MMEDSNAMTLFAIIYTIAAMMLIVMGSNIFNNGTNYKYAPECYNGKIYHKYLIDGKEDYCNNDCMFFERKNFVCSCLKNEQYYTSNLIKTNETKCIKNEISR